MLGALSTLACVIRLGFISQAFTVGCRSEANHHMAGTPPAVWSTVEGAIRVLAAYLPLLGPLVRKTPGAKEAMMFLSEAV